MTTGCSGCGKSVDPLRAGHVAIFDERFLYFCDSSCRKAVSGLRTPKPSRAPVARMLSRSGSSVLANAVAPPPAAARAPSNPLRSLATRVDAVPLGHELAQDTGAAHAGPAARALAAASPDRPSPAFELDREASSPAEYSSPVSTRSRRAAYAQPPPSEGAQALLWVAGSAGALAVSLALAGSSPTVVSLRIALTLVGLCSLMVRAVQSPREPTEAHPTFVLAPAVTSCALAIWTWLVRDRAIDEATMFAAVIISEIAAALGLVVRARQSWSTERRRIGVALSGAGPADPRVSLLPDARVGEELELQAGEVLQVDGTVLAGEAVVLPWIGASDAVKRREGESLHAGALVQSGWLRVRATYVGFDRAWARLTLDPRRRAEVHARVARVARRVGDRGALAALVLAGAAAMANGETAPHVAMASIGAWAALSCVAIAAMPAVHVARGVLEGLRRGIGYRSPDDWDRAGEVSIAAFCARGTLLLGEPELADLVPVGKTTDTEVLSLAAGAEGGAQNPVAWAVQRAAAARSVRPDAVRSPIVQPGLGVTAVASSGEPLCVGSRALLLREKISVAIAEQTVAAIEGRGREVLLVAKGGKLVGVIGLQDGLRPGARAAVQHLLDAQVEPVLMSGDSRETCEAIGRALDIDHIRPEVLAADRAKEIERLGHGGITVAVLGHPRIDEATLAAADVAVAMPALGGTPGEWSVMLASDDVRDGALAISLARRTKHDARVSLIFAVAPGVVASLAVAFGLLAPAWAPIAALAGALASGFHARASDLTRLGAASAVKPRSSRV